MASPKTDMGERGFRPEDLHGSIFPTDPTGHEHGNSPPNFGPIEHTFYWELEGPGVLFGSRTHASQVRHRLGGGSAGRLRALACFLVCWLLFPPLFVLCFVVVFLDGLKVCPIY